MSPPASAYCRNSAINGRRCFAASRTMAKSVKIRTGWGSTTTASTVSFCIATKAGSTSTGGADLECPELQVQRLGRRLELPQLSRGCRVARVRQDADAAGDGNGLLEELQALG